MNLRSFLFLAPGFVLAACAGGPEADSFAARAFTEEGREAAKKGDHAKAVTFYTKAIGADPAYPDAWYERGTSNIRLRLDPASGGEGRSYEDRALADYSQAIELNRNLGDVYYNRAMVLSSRAQYRAAAEDLLSAVRLKPQDPEPHLDLARIYEQKFEDMQAQAFEHYEKYADLGGRDRDAREKARLHKERKKAAAAPAGKAATEEDEKKAQELHVRAMALLKDEKKDEAVKAVDELLSAYARTRYVQERLAILKALQAAFKK